MAFTVLVAVTVAGFGVVLMGRAVERADHSVALLGLAKIILGIWVLRMEWNARESEDRNEADS